MKIRPKFFPRVSVLEVIARMIINILGENQDGILRGQLLFDRAAPCEAGQFIVRSNASIVLIIQIKRITRVAEGPELRGQFASLAIAPPTRVRNQTKPIDLEKS